MKKTLILTLILALSGTMLASNAGIQTGEKERGYISISSSANADIAPDTAEISFEVKTSDTKSMQKATVMNKEISEKIYNTLKEMINTSKGDYIKTSNYNASPIYNYNDKKRTLEKYEVSNRVTVRTKSIEKLGTMIDKATEAGATNIDSLSFSVSDTEAQCNSLIEKAAKKANTRAAVAAKGAGGILDGIKSMDISCSENSSYVTPRYRLAKGMMMMDAAANSVAEESSTSISSGVIKIFANVNATFYLK